MFGQGCEIDCIYCKRNYYHEKGIGSKTYEDIIKDIREKVKENKDTKIRLRFTGVGEPLMLPELLVVCKEVNKMGIPFDIETNGIKLSDFDLCKKLVALGLENIDLTFQSHIKEVYKTIIGGYDYYEMIIKALENISKLKLGMSLNIPIIKQNIDHFHRVPFFISQNFPKLCLQGTHFHLVRINSPAEMFREAGFPLSKYANQIQNQIFLVKKEGYSVGLSTSAGSFPFCFFPLLIREFNYDQKKFITDDMHIKTKYCKGCKYYNDCPGVAYTYLELYGEEEFKDKAVMK